MEHLRFKCILNVVYVFLFMSMYSYCCLCILIVRPRIFIVVYVFLLLSMYSYFSSMYSYRCLCNLIVVYVFLLFVHVFLSLSMYSYCCLCILIVRLPCVRVFLAFSSVVRQMPGCNSPRCGTAHAVPKILYCSTYCLFCVVLCIVGV